VLTAFAIAVAVAAFAIGYAIGVARRRATAVLPETASGPAEVAGRVAPETKQSQPPPGEIDDRASAERARVIRGYEAETHALRHALANRDAAIAQWREFAADRQVLFADLAASRAETARYRQLVVDLENNAPPPLFGPGAPDDLKLIVGVGPVLERMLHQLGVATFRQIAYWSERDIDEFDAKLPEFPGRIRRDVWVTQARALHQSKYGEILPARAR
jgi:predicted flap endonuclease-1-like 5' DNA nuclease